MDNSIFNGTGCDFSLSVGNGSLYQNGCSSRIRVIYIKSVYAVGKIVWKIEVFI